MSNPVDAPRPQGAPDFVEPQKQGRGCFFYGCAGCLVLTILVLIVVSITVYKVYSYLLSFTADEPMAIPAVEASAERYQEIKSRVDAFTKAVEEGKAAELDLTGEEINILIANDTNWKELKGKAFVKIEGDEVKADASIPLTEVPGFKGRYLNGTVGAKISLENGIFMVTPQTVVVNNKPLPDQVMSHLRSVNLAQDAYKDQEKVDFIKKFKSIQVKDGKIIVKSNASAAEEKPAEGEEKKQ